MPIAIVGRACLLPGAHDPAALFALAREGRCVLRDAPEGAWRVPTSHVLAASPEEARDRTWTRRGGYVEGFRFDPDGYAVPAEVLGPLDPLVHWVIDTAARALDDAGVRRLDARRTGAVLGNLGLPSSGSARFAEHVWLGAHARGLGEAAPAPLDRFQSGLPAHLAARALGLGAGAFALDAACASSLYAIAYACDALAEGRADRMLAGAVSAADDLFLHVGFCALGAMSKTGQSRPFHAGADGLVPAAGCGFVVLERLDDAVRAGRTIHGVIRGVGLANDGRGEGLLAPSARGQARSMELALARAGLAPEDVPYVECHATGTPVGDATELASLRAVYGDAPRRIGSLKANLGHLITAAGVAGLIKILESLREGVALPTPHLDRSSDALDDSPFEVLDAPAPWRGPRRAGLSAFGFGGNDAHLLVEAYEPAKAGRAATAASRASGAVVVVGLGARVGDGGSAADLERALFDRRPVGRAQAVKIPLAALRFPPADLAKARPAQTQLLAAAIEASRGLTLPSETTGVYVGYGCDPEIARWGARWRARAFAEALGADEAWAREAADALVAPLEAPHVVGALPNIPANRLSSQFDLRGPSHAVMAEELSGVRALELAVRALARGDLDAALVGAVDLADEPVHRAASADADAADAAVALVLMRRADAEREGCAILAELASAGETSPGERFASGLPRAHAASGLVEVTAALVFAARGRRPDGSAWTDAERSLSVEIEALGSERAAFVVTARGAPIGPLPEAPDAPCLELPAHPPPVLLPALRAPVVEIMQPAPPLPPTRLDGPPAPPVSAAEVFAATPASSRGDEAHGAPASPAPAADPAPPPARPTAPTSAAPPAHAPVAAPVAATPFGASGWLAAHVEHQSRLADAHRHFVEQQSLVHQQFLQALVTLPTPLAAAPVVSAPVVSAPAVSAPVVSAPVASAPVVSAPVVSAPVASAPVASAPVASAPVAAPPTAPAAGRPAPGSVPSAFRPRGPSFDRDALRIHAGGRISTIFGPEFAQQDAHAVQVRMPEPPLLLADRCTGIDAVPGSMGKGVCWTETDVRADSWYLHDGAMPTGIMVESGQADLFLISYLGVDFLNRGERAYRLLGCEMTWEGDLPTIGETLAYEIHVDGHAAQGDVRLFFFHYDCYVRRADGTTRPALRVRGGQAGFFTEAELAASAGILWRPERQEIRADARVDPPATSTSARRFERSAIEAFAAGRPWECFGDGYERTKTHTRTPRIQDGRMLFLDTVEVFDPTGGPWGRGYLKAVTPITADDWFFAGHFKNDPCMPGTLMLEGCVQAMAFYLAAMGYTVERDGWRFRPIPDETYSLRCRGQVIPSSRELTYEVFVEEVHDGPAPRLYADLLCTVDGLGAFHARRFGLELVPSWPLTSRPELSREGAGDARAATASYQGAPPFRFDYPSLLACAWGQPSTAFGPMYARFDGARRTPRLPGPPYHFLSRVTSVDGAMGGLEASRTFTFEYDVPPDAWYFRENGARVMPFAVLLEAALQPCGWVASYVGSTLTSESDFLFRNLDGEGTILAEVLPESGTLRSTVTIRNISRSSGMIIESFEVRCALGETDVYALKTVFGFFPPEAFEDQAGLPTSPAQRALLEAPSNVHVDLTARPARFARGTLRLAEPMLLMIDRVTRFEPTGGASGLGALRAEKDVDAGEWFFKAHFYQDPVQPGSLGIEAMLQLLQVFMIEAGLGEGIEAPRFEAIAVDRPHVWKYRGQVVPENRLISTTMEIVEKGADERGAYALADASLWVDGKRIYEAKRLGMRIVAGVDERRAAGDETLDPAQDRWLGDHRPTYTAPALPMMSMLDRMVAAARAARGPVDGLRDLRVERWLVVEGPTRITTEVEGDEVRLYAWRDAPRAALSRFELVARATIDAPPPLPAPAPLRDATAIEPYAGERLFHGPAFHYARRLSLGAAGSTMVLDAGRGAVPFGAIHQGLFDAATHGIPHDALHLWSSRIGDDVVGYPHRLDVRLSGEVPRAGEVVCEARFAGFDGDDARFPVVHLWLQAGGRTFAELRLTEVLLPKGPLGMAAPVDRRRFLAERAFVAGVGLARSEGGATVLAVDDVARSDWFPGTIEAVYGTRDPRAIAIAEHVAASVSAHPSTVSVEREDAVCAHAPLTAHRVIVAEERGRVSVRAAAPPRLAIAPVVDFWRAHFDVGPWPVEELYYGLVERFVAAVHLEDPRALAALRGRGVLYLANHQVGIESLVFSIVASALAGVPTQTLAKAEHRTSWLGRLIAHCFTWPGVEDPGVIAYFDRSDPSSLPSLVRTLASGAHAKSLMVHVEGTRALGARQPVEKMSGVFCDLAIEAGVPVVPVRFSGGLPVEPAAARLEYPVGMGRQDYWIGRPISPSELAALPYKARTERVVAAIEGLGPPRHLETPHAPDPAFEARVRARAEAGVEVGLAAIAEVLAERAGSSEPARALCEVLSGRAPLPSDPAEAAWLSELAARFGTRR
ncbi:MAG: 3-hydroxyacyl-[acyl-carrier-protein] dehydratase FabA [Sandaracinaceae bacterium]|nr:3-hydroxyacyl-[acyl-carrier-protein] dehydratase FabA [Sandaracinaceae bacterium]